MEFKLHGVSFDAHQVVSYTDWQEWAAARFFVGDPDQEVKLKEVHARATELTKPPEKPERAIKK